VCVFEKWRIKKTIEEEEKEEKSAQYLQCPGRQVIFMSFSR